MPRIYLDHHTVTRQSPSSIEAMQSFLSDRWGSIYSPHSFGSELHIPTARALDSVANIIGASESDTIVFVSSTAEAINHLVFAIYLDVTRENGKNHFITSQLEEAHTILSISRMEQLGCTYALVPPNSQGLITVEAVKQAITPQTAFISLSWAQGMTGVIHEIEEIGQLCRDNGILFHLDISYALGKMICDLDALGADFISFSANQIHGPTGIAALCFRHGIEMSPLIIGGMEQGGLRSGELNIPAIVAFGKAAQEMNEKQERNSLELPRLRDLFEETLKQKIPEIMICFEEEFRLPNCTVAVFPGVHAEAMLYALNKQGVFASFGGGSHQRLSQILSAIGFDQVSAQSALHFSISQYTTEEEVIQAAELAERAWRRLRKISKELL